jgi:hypothetical protein
MSRLIPKFWDYPQIGRLRKDPNLAMANSDSLLIARGLIDGISHVNISGDNPDITAGTEEDVSDVGGAYPFPTTPDMTHLRQAVNQVAMLGQIIEVRGLDTNWNKVVQTKALDASNTTTPVVLDTALKRVNEMGVLANVVTDQNIELRNVGGGTTYALIQAGKNHTLAAIFTVANGETGFMPHYYADNVATAARQPDSVEFKLWTADRYNGYEFQLKNERAIPKLGPGFIHPFKPYRKITQRTDIKISAKVIGGVGDDGHPHAGFDLILIDD